MGLYDLNRKMKIARQRGFSFNQIQKLTTKNLFTSTIYKHKILPKTSSTNVS